MRELNELKQKIFELTDVLKRLALNSWRLLDRKISKRIPNQTVRILLGAVTVSFVFGLLFGSLLFSGGSASATNAPSVSRPFGGSLFTFFFGKTIPVPGHQKDQGFVLADFEQDSALKVWKLVSSKMEISERRASEGKRSARILLYGGEEVSAITMKDYFSSRGGVRDWSRYGAFRFHLFNPRGETERLILQIKDERGIRFKQNIHVPANKGETFEFKIEKIAGQINVREIDQVSLFRWEPKGDREFYLDDVRLVPAGYQKEKPAGAALQIAVKSRPVRMLDYGFAARKYAWLAVDPATRAARVRIPFIVENESGSDCASCPAEGGVPFPMGEIREPHEVWLRDAAGPEPPFQARVAARWPDQSVKWLNIHFMTALRAGQGAGYFLEYGSEHKPIPDQKKIEVEDTNDKLAVVTGPLRAVLSKKNFYLFESVQLDLNSDKVFDAGETIVTKAPLTLTFQDDEYRTDLDDKTYRIEIEEKGNQRVVIKAAGWFQSEKGARYCRAIVRCYFYAGKSTVKVAHTLVYTGYPENSYYDKYKGIQLPANETLGSFGFRLPYQLPGGEGTRIYVGREKAGPLVIASLPATNLGGRAKQSQTGIASVATPPRNDKEARFIQNAWDQAPENFSGWFDISTDKAGISVAIRHFRENFPKGFALDTAKDQIQVDLWPKEAGPLDLAVTGNALGPEDRARGNAFGLAKSHEVLFYFHPLDSEKSHAAQISGSFREPFIVRMNPYWTDATGVLGRLYPTSERYATEEVMLDKLFDWAARQQRDFKWYGMLNFGDTLTWWRNEDEEQWYGEYGWHPTGRWGWYNCEGVGLHTGALLQFARSGRWKYFEFGKNLARHIMDIDTVHDNTIANDPRLKGKLDDEVSRVGSMHRHSGDHWSGRNEEASHTSVVGLLIYYYLSGDRRAFDVAKEIGEFFLQEPFTYTDHPDVAPHRAMANALWGDVLLYEATGDRRFKNAADKIIEIYLRGRQSDGSFLENYNPLDGTWSGSKHTSYMEGYALGAFMAYHELTQDEEVKEMLLKMVRYLGNATSGAEALHGISYAYFLTGDKTYLDMADKGLNELLANRQVSSDSLIDGLIYKKIIYHRPNAYLYSTPYVFEALEAGEAGRRR